MKNVFWKHLLIFTTLTIFTGCTTAMTTQDTSIAVDESQVRMVVESLGKSLKQVSLTAEPQIVSEAIKTTYAPYLTANLLNSWVLEPDLALGKVTSSPWPERIEITQVTKSADTEYHVMGNVIQVTSDTITAEQGASQDPIDLIVQKVNNKWLINEAKLLDTVQTTQSTYTDNGISVQYPNTVRIETGVTIDSGNLDKKLVKFLVPAEIVDSEGTNFNEAFLLISSSTKTDSIKSCLNYADVGAQNKPVTTKINNIEFSSLDIVEAAAGNLYKNMLYRAINNNTCYELALVIHASNIHNYDPPVKQFDTAQVTQILMPIVNSVQFHN